MLGARVTGEAATHEVTFMLQAAISWLLKLVCTTAMHFQKHVGKTCCLLVNPQNSQGYGVQPPSQGEGGGFVLALIPFRWVKREGEKVQVTFWGTIWVKIAVIVICIRKDTNQWGSLVGRLSS